jgi:hypothetical protein
MLKKETIFDTGIFVFDNMQLVSPMGNPSHLAKEEISRTRKPTWLRNTLFLY